MIYQWRYQVYGNMFYMQGDLYGEDVVHQEEGIAMKLGIMQPYFFPYIGYWQLMTHVDTFVLLDDVNYIKRGWINRNNILLNGKAHLFTIPIEGASQNKLIMETKMNFLKMQRIKWLRTIRMAYGKAAYFLDVFPLLQNIMNNDAIYI